MLILILNITEIDRRIKDRRFFACPFCHMPLTPRF